MSGISVNGCSVGNCLLAVVFLALLTSADNVLTDSLPLMLGSEPAQIPGFWNLITTALIVSTVSDLVGQLVLISVAYHYGPRYAMNLNSLSVLIASIFLLALRVWRAVGPKWLPAVAGIFKIIGGGSHATAFLTITLIQDSTSGSTRAAIILATGAVTVVCQTIASTVTPFLVSQSPNLPYIISIACCVLAGTTTIAYDTTRNSNDRQGWATGSSMQPLLSHRASSRGPSQVAPWKLAKIYNKRWNNKSSITRRVLKSLGLIFFLAAIAKATRPLFITYIQHRAGVTPELASYLWNVRTVMSLIIFLAILPSIVTVSAKYTSKTPSTTTLYIAKLGVAFLASGALFIGLARSKSLLISGLVINTLGVATDSALLAFAADVVTEDLALCFFMTIASLESTGTLAGIGLLYPLYQLGLHDDTLFGGTPYYVCAGLFTMTGIGVWKIKPIVSQ